MEVPLIIKTPNGETKEIKHWIIVISIPEKQGLLVFDSSAFGLDIYRDFIENAKENIIKPMLLLHYPDKQKIEDIISSKTIMYSEELVQADPRDLYNCGVWMLLTIQRMTAMRIKDMSLKELLNGCIKYLKT
jgi:hypothetical protein